MDRFPNFLEGQRYGMSDMGMIVNGSEIDDPKKIGACRPNDHKQGTKALPSGWQTSPAFRMQSTGVRDSNIYVPLANRRDKQYSH